MGGVLVVAIALETVMPLRRTVEPRARRIGRNLATLGISAAVLSFIHTPVVVPLSRWVVAHDVGLLRLLPLGDGVRTALGVVLLDYTLWFWHYANHKVDFFWRFHLVHHVDRDLDASTGLRFHFGELGLSVGYRALQIVLIGADPLAVWTWQSLLSVGVLFHHSNVRLPIGLERWLVRIVVTPRMHGIHHSDRQGEADTNYSSLLSGWDVLHRTMLLNVPQRDVVIGVPAYQEPSRVALGPILVLPFQRRGGEGRADAPVSGGRGGRSAPERHGPDGVAKRLGKRRTRRGGDWARADGQPSSRVHDPSRRLRLEP